MRISDWSSDVCSSDLDLGFGGRRGDRHGRELAHLYEAEGRWLQGEMLSAGLARVYSFSDNRTAVAEMLALDRATRAPRRGILRDPFSAVRSAATPGHLLSRLARSDIERSVGEKMVRR